MAVPQVNRRTVEALLTLHTVSLRRRGLVLVHGRYASGAPQQFTLTLDEKPRRVRVRDETSVLGVLTAWQDHGSEAAPGDILVVTTSVDDAQLGWDLRGRAILRRTLTVDKAEVVVQRFGAGALDVRMYREHWLLDALIDAEPAERGWPRVGGMLTRDTAMRALTVQRLGLGGASEDGPEQQVVDADALLAWSRTAAGPLRFAELPEKERAELKKWLGEVAGPAVRVLMSLAEAGLAPDAMALGILGAALREPTVGPDAVLAIGGMFGSARPRRAELGAFTDAVEGTMVRWIAEARTSHTARRRVFAVLDRADELARTGQLTDALTTSRFLPASFSALLRRTVAEARVSPQAGESALVDLKSHGLVGLFPESVQAAEMAVRTARWLARPEPAVSGVAAGVRAHVRDWGWVDRALTVLWSGDPGGDLETGQELRALYEQASTRRRRLDARFAHHLAPWVAHATAEHPDGCLLIENVLEQVVRPLTVVGPPLLLVLDGMSSAVAAQLGEEVEREGWREVVPRPAEGEAPGRLAAVTMVPSITLTGRASLLSGERAKGGQSVEAAGFAAFWQRRSKEAALFHKAAIGGDAGHVLSHELMAALASPAVVAVVLNTIDDALDSGRQGSGTSWSIADITYLRELLAAARGYGRPVVLVADHGYVLEHGGHTGPSGAAPDDGQAVSARWRTGGEASEGEVTLHGPRVLEGGGTVTVPWREDIRYTGRRAGYHGGAALAEMAVPVLALVPAGDLAPKDWRALPREQSVPGWWQEAVSGISAPAPLSEDAVRPVKARTMPLSAEAVRPSPNPSADAAADGGTSLGSRVVASEMYQAHKGYVRKGPDPEVVAAVIDVLVATGGTMSPDALVAAISAPARWRRNIKGFIATVQRLLNVEGYPVLGFVDAGHAVKLDTALLCDQFLPKEEE